MAQRSKRARHRRPSVSPTELAAGVLAGEERAAARFMRLADDWPERARPALATLYKAAGGAVVIGVTGNPGAGKSTLVAQLIASYRAAGEKVGVIAVDPSSPFSGGAILGDRVRMMDHAADPGVFIRSVASRGALGGVSRSTDDLVTVLDAFGCGIILVETLGVGQAEVEIVELAQTTLVVLTPGYGDEVQSLKAGLLEIADLFVVNKADLPGADGLVRQLRALWELTPDHDEAEWRPPVLKTVARDGQGIDELVQQIAAHTTYRTTHPAGRARERERYRRIVLRLVQDELMRRVANDLLPPDELDAALDDLVDRRRDPYSLAESVLARLKDVAHD